MLYYLYRIGKSITLRLPRKTCYKLAEFLADIYYLFARGDRRNLEYNLKVILKTNNKKLIRQHIKNVFRNFAKYLVDFFRFPKLSRDYILKHVTIEGKENIDKALANGKGAIILAAHFGSWELGAAILASLGYSFYAIALSHKDKRIDDFFLKQRAIADVKIIPIGAQLRNCFEVLKKNCLLGILGDKDFSNHGIKTTFFGRQTILPKGPAFFSLKTGAFIIPSFLIRTKTDDFKLIFEEPIESSRTDSKEAGIKNIMQKYISLLERYIRAFPDQWYVFRKVWD